MTRKRLPAMLVFLLLASAFIGCSGSVATPTAPTTPPADLTTAEGVLEASIEAQGGRTAMGAITSMRMRGAVTIEQLGATGTVEMIAAPPRQVRSDLDIAGLGMLSQGVSGDVSWESVAMTGDRIFAGNEARISLRDATFNADLRWRELFPTATLEGEVNFDGTACFKVVLTDEAGDSVTRYIAKDTLLPRSTERIADTQMGKIPVVTTTTDYRQVGGVLLAHKIIQQLGAVIFVMTADTFETSVDLPAGAFDLPPAIQALQ